MCNCVNVEMGSYDNQVAVPVPDYIELLMNAPGQARRETVCIDACLFDEVKALWRVGITTTGCCCGHNKIQGYIGVVDGDIHKMKALGYVVAYNSGRPNDEDSFVPRSGQ